MTEREWLACADPQEMLEFLRGKASDRKLRLFAVASCRRTCHLLTDETTRKVVEVHERFVDGEATDRDLEVTMRLVWEAMNANRVIGYLDRNDYPSARAWRMAIRAKRRNGQALKAVAHIGHFNETAAEWARRAKGIAAEKTPQAMILRCIFGNPFNPVALSTTCLTPTVVSLAQAIYDERAFDRMPVLADALEEAGCNSADLLAHCRQPGDHVRGCFVVDLVLGKE